MTGTAPAGSVGRVAWWEASRLVARHPSLYKTAVAQLLHLAPRGWWRRWPPVPAPSKAWLEFRQETQYGSKDAPIDPRDIVAWLEWCREQRVDTRVGRRVLVASRRTR